jgi:hypothetical protein
MTEEQQVGEEVRKEQIDLDEGSPDVRDDRRPSRSAPAMRRDGGQHRRGAGCCAGGGHLPLLG